MDDIHDRVATLESTGLNDVLSTNLLAMEELERELPVVYDGQVPLGDLLSRFVQAIYAELAELAETLPNMSDTARKRTLADWVVKTKKQVVKLYAVAKWSRDADTVQKCMNITAFLMTQNQQFGGAVAALKYARESLDSARLRNHDLLTSLDVLSTGSYLRLPTCIKKTIIPPSLLTDEQVGKTLDDMEDVMRYRLRLSEIVPIEMSSFRIEGGRVYFTVPKLFEASLCLRGAEKDDGWFFCHVEFLINIGGDLTGFQEFPRTPDGVMKRYITDEADARLAFYLPFPDEPHPPTVETPSRPQLPEGMINAPLVRLFNFLQIMSLSYQLEILWYQAEHIRSLGWADFLNVQMSQDRKTMTTSYWVRPALIGSQGRQRTKLPSFGGTISISIVESRGISRSDTGPMRSPRARIFTKLQHAARFGDAKPSDEVEGLKFQVRWEAAKGVLGLNPPPEAWIISDGALVVDAENLDFESMLRNVIGKHTRVILQAFTKQLQLGSARNIFGTSCAVKLMGDGSHALQVHLCADEIVTITIDPRTGRLNLRDTGDLAAASRGPRFAMFSEKLNENPTALQHALMILRITTITDLAEQKAQYLGLQAFRYRNFPKEEQTKLGSSARGTLFIQLQNFHNHYLVLVITDEEFRYALITTRIVSESMFSHMVMEDIAWLDFKRIHGESVIVSNPSDQPDARPERRKAGDMAFFNGSTDSQATHSSFNLDTQVLRELYSYCCARVAYMNVERQFKLRGIPFTHVNPMAHGVVSTELSHIQSSLARSVPVLCVQAKHILSGAPAAEAAMPNIRVTPLNWWSGQNAQVVTSVKLKYVQQPLGGTAGTSAVIRPSKRIIYDTTLAVVSFLSENVNTCVDEFLEEWARVSKMVVIAREVARMAKKNCWQDVRLISFDLQTVEFTYAQDYTISITCQDQLSPMGGNFDLRFSRSRPPHDLNASMPAHGLVNPHDDAEPFLRNILRHGQGRLGDSLHRLVKVLRETLPIVTVLEHIRLKNRADGLNIDVFAKAAGWYRLLFGDLRHALDFRSMNDQCVAILDGSYSPFTSPTPSLTTPTLETVENKFGLEPIPQFAEIVTGVVRTGVASGELKPGRIAIVDVGVVCDISTVYDLGQSLFTKVAEQGFN